MCTPCACRHVLGPVAHSGDGEGHLRAAYHARRRSQEALAGMVL